VFRPFPEPAAACCSGGAAPWPHTSSLGFGKSGRPIARIATSIVCTTAGLHHTRREIVGSIAAGNQWITSAGGYTATIATISFCPRLGRLAAPYIKTKPTSTVLDNLENLPEC
jgi:hypothetical protein